MSDLVLASTSKYRRELLARLGLAFRAVAPHVDENALKDVSLPPQDLAEMLAEAKAVSLTASEPGATILGSDQVAACDGRILGKPGNAPAAAAQLGFLSGRRHQLITAICLWHRGRILRHTDVTMMTMRSLDPAEIARYLAVDQPYDCAGSYKLESRGITLFSSIESDDHTAIVGLPLIAVTSLLRSLGFAIP